MTRKDVWYMVRRRASDAGIETAIGCHTFRATGITDYLTNGGRIKVAQRMAGPLER
jgi:integrase/recombinase XerD